MNLQLLKRPQPLPRVTEEKDGVHAQWGVKAFFYRKKSFPLWSFKAQAQVRYSSLVITGQFPKRRKEITLIDIGYVEDEGDILDVRGCNFRLLLFGIDNIVQIRDWLRFLIIRQRVPHSILGKPFEWQVSPAASLVTEYFDFLAQGKAGFLEPSDHSDPKILFTDAACQK